MQKPREIAARLLLPAIPGPDFVENRLDAALSEANLSSPDRRLVQEMVYGIVRWRDTLDWLIQSKTQGRTQKPILTSLLRLGLYQIFWLDRIPDHAAVNETVELVREMGCGPQSGFVNAVLRGCLREKEIIQKQLADLRQEHPAIGYSHPAWLCERWTERWGAEKTIQLMEWNNTTPKTYARVNTLRTDAGRLLTRWREQEGVEYEFVRWDWTGENLVFELKEHPAIATLGSFREGWFYVQDPSTLLAVKMLDPQPGERILDMCAAPGGKTSYIAQLMQNQGQISAQDNDPKRIMTLRENLDRLNASCATTSRPSGVVLPDLDTPFDRVLVDAPCSNTGVMRRRVDLRWRIHLHEITRLQMAQVALLRKAALHVKPKGVLVYSTCSIEPEENRKMVDQFITEHPGWTSEEDRELLPFNDKIDGAYVARLRAP